MLYMRYRLVFFLTHLHKLTKLIIIKSFFLKININLFIWKMQANASSSILINSFLWSGNFSWMYSFQYYLQLKQQFFNFQYQLKILLSKTLHKKIEPHKIKWIYETVTLFTKLTILFSLHSHVFKWRYLNLRLAEMFFNLRSFREIYYQII